MEKSERDLLACENPVVYHLLMMAAGMMGAYTFIFRGGVFCNAQTANLVMLAAELGRKKWAMAAYYLVPIFAYFAGTLISELIPKYIKKSRLIRWDTLLVFIEIMVLTAVGFIPLSINHHVVQIMINFIASMQYNTFRQADHVPMATTFCTNHIRQSVIWLVKGTKEGDRDKLKRGFSHISMLLIFILGGVLVSISGLFIKEMSIWVAILPMTVTFGILLYADLKSQKELLMETPSGH